MKKLKKSNVELIQAFKQHLILKKLDLVNLELEKLIAFY